FGSRPVISDRAVLCRIRCGAGHRGDEPEGQSRADTDDIDSTRGHMPVSLEPSPQPAADHAPRCGGPLVPAKGHATNRAEPGSQNRQQTRKFRDEVTTVRPPEAIGISDAGGIY